MRKLMILACAILGLAGAAHTDTRTIYQDQFNTPGTNTGGTFTSSLQATAPNVRGTDFDGASYAGQVWDCAGSETNWWGQTNQGTAPNTYVHASSSDFLAFTPKAGEVYTLTATIQSLSGVDWFTLAFVPARGNWAGGNGTPLYNQPKIMDLSDGNSDRGLVRGGATKTISLTLDTTATGWTNTMGLAYVGWVTDSPGAQGANISNFSLTATIPGSSHNIRGTVRSGGAALSGATVYYSTTSGGPYSTVTTAGDGTYSISVNDNSGPYYIKAGKDGYITSAEYSPAPSVGTSDVTGIDFTLNVTPVIYSDLLIGSGPLNGAAAQVSNSVAGGTGGSSWAAGGSVTRTGSGVTYTNPDSAFLPFQPQPGCVYTLTATLTNNSDWAALGFSDSSTNGTWHTTGSKFAWALVRPSGGGAPQFFGGPRQSWSSTASGTQTVSITLDTTAAQWKTYATINGVSSSVYTYPENPNINYVGFGTDAGTSTVSNFSLTASGNVQPTVHITGKVTRPDGVTGVAGATVYYSLTSGAGYKSVTTASDGTFSIIVWGSSTQYLLAYKSPDYLHSAEIAVPVGSGDVSGVNLVLAPAPSYTITASVNGTGGSITPAGVSLLYQGQSQIFSVTPDSGNAVTILKIDGVPIHPAQTYTFMNISANHTIVADFGRPVGMNGKSVLTGSIAPNRVIKTWGKVKSINGSTSFIINDGYGDMTVMLNDQTPSGLDTTRIATVTGLLDSDRKVWTQKMSITPDAVDGVVEIKKMHYGFFVHYVWAGSGGTIDKYGHSPATFDDFANAFDAEGFANDLAAWQVEYVIFTIWHFRINPLFPSQTVLDWGLSDHHCNVDLASRILKACKAKGIKVIFYTHPRDGHDLLLNDQILTGWGPGSGGSDPNWSVFNFQKWNDFTCQLYGELVDHCGSDLFGLWLDEGSGAGDSYRVVDYPRLRQTIKSKNPNLVMIQNYYGNLYSCDIGCKEYNRYQEFANPDGRVWPAYNMSVGTCFASNWSAMVPQGTNTVWLSAKDMFRYTVLNAGSNTDGGGVAWASGPYAGGGWETGVYETMSQVGAYVKPIAQSIKGVYASKAYPTAAGATINSIQWGVATDAVDGSATYLHVLKAQAGRSLSTGLAANGVVFSGATMLKSGMPCGFTSNGSGYVITLPDGENWDSLDTVIKLQVAGH